MRRGENRWRGTIDKDNFDWTLDRRRERERKRERERERESSEDTRNEGSWNLIKLKRSGGWIITVSFFQSLLFCDFFI